MSLSALHRAISTAYRMALPWRPLVDDGAGSERGETPGPLDSLSQKLGSGHRASECGENRRDINLALGERVSSATYSKKQRKPT